MTPEEKNEIQALFERRNGLTELAQVLTADKADLYEKLVSDLGETSRKFQQWWDDKSRAYNWDRDDNGNWEIDFSTCDIYLVTK